ncbi:MAG: hypothetical protein JO083_04140 [Candidatus Eremiobacteraeota bacterium]|nr:hypothetical protein [Candidatus Eremiobacteraeota bacterium]MBV8368073.1 hypothetical protein [Candidatus Eremiobacteraeota bacterium]
MALGEPTPEPLHTPAPVDKVCSRAPARIADFNAAAETNDFRKIAAAADRVVNAYHLCELDWRLGTAHGTAQADEPGANYLVARQAQYLIVEGRCYGLLGDTAAALRVFRQSDKLAELVAEWQPSSVTLNGRNTDLGRSIYRPAALDIRAAASYEMQKLFSRRQRQRPGLTPAPPPPIPEIKEPPSPAPSPSASSL